MLTSGKPGMTNPAAVPVSVLGRMLLPTTLLTVLLAMLLTSGCHKREIDELRVQNQDILKRLSDLEEAQKNADARPDAGRQADPSTVYSIALGDSPTRGRADASVSIVEYSDFQCPYCAQVQPLLMQLLEKYPRDVKLVFKHFPLSFHAAAKPATIASLAAQEQGKFWEMHDVLFANFRTLSTSKLEDYAREAGLDIERWRQDLLDNQERYAGIAEEDYNLGISVSVRGTPTLFVNGVKVQDRSFEGISAMIEAARNTPGS